MTKRDQKIVKLLNKVCDLVILFVVYYLATWFWRTVSPESAHSVAYTYKNPWLFPMMFSIVTFITYEVCGIYDALRARPIREDVFALFKSNVIAFFIIFASFYLLHFYNYPRGIMGGYFIFSFLGILVKRLLMRYVLSNNAKFVNIKKNVLVIGSGKLAQEYCQTIQKHPEFGSRVEGYFGDQVIKGEKHLGSLSEAEQYINNPEVDEVVIALEESMVEKFPSFFSEAERAGKKTSIITIYNQYLSRKATIDIIENVKILNISESPLDYSYNFWIKRLFDIVLSVFLLTVLSPLLLVTYLGVKISSPGSAIFKQERVGYNGKHFIMYKFRSMRINAAENTGWTKNTDSRKTAFGSFIRKTSIDELPQLFNVLKGDMSFIGPRPEIPHYVDLFSKTIPHYMLKHRVMPGITGWAQVNGFRGDTSIEGRIQCDIWYIENWSVSLDIRIVFMTIFGGLINKEKISKSN